MSHITIHDTDTGKLVWIGSMAAFLEANADGLDDYQVAALRDLEPGDSMMLGGGAAPLVEIWRVPAQ